MTLTYRLTVFAVEKRRPFSVSYISGDLLVCFIFLDSLFFREKWRSFSVSHIFGLTVFVMKSRDLLVSHFSRLTVFAMKNGDLLMCLIHLDSLLLSEKG